MSPGSTTHGRGPITRPTPCRLKRLTSWLLIQINSVTSTLQFIPRSALSGRPLPSLTIWQMNVGDGVAGPVDLDAGGEDTLILRPAAEVEVRLMAPGGAEFAAALAAGKSASEAAQTAIDADRAFDLSSKSRRTDRCAGAFIGSSFRSEPASMRLKGAK